MHVYIYIYIYREREGEVDPSARDARRRRSARSPMIPVAPEAALRRPPPRTGAAGRRCPLSAVL